MRRLALALLLVCLPACRPRQSLSLRLLTPAVAPGSSDDPLAAVDTLEARPDAAPYTPSASAPFREGQRGSLDLEVLLGPTPQTLDLLGLGNNSVLALGRTFPLRAGDASATVYVGLVDTFAPTPSPRPDGGTRVAFSATPFAGGAAVLVAGGVTTRAMTAAGLPAPPASDTIAGALELYDAATGSFAGAGADLHARVYHAAVAVGDAVYLLGGYGSDGPLDEVVRVTRDAAGVHVAADGTLPTPLWGHAACALDDGSILVAGGYVDAAGTLATSAYVYVPGGNSTPVPLPAPRAFAVATSLHDNQGEVLVSGGLGAAGVLADALVYQPAHAAFALPRAGGVYRAQMASARVGHSATLLGDGVVFISGGSDGTSSVVAPEAFDPLQLGFVDVEASAMPVARQNHAAVALADGSLLLFGGEATTGGAPAPVATIERVAPSPGASLGGNSAFSVTLSPVAAPLAHAGALGAGLALGDQSILYLAPDAAAALFVPCYGACLAP